MKLAIVKLSAMGDIIHAMVALQFIKKFHPTIQIDWFVEKAFAKVLEYNPHIDNIYTVHLKAIKKDKLAIFSQIKLLRQYSKTNYDLVIDAQGLIKSSIVARLLGSSTAGFDKHSTREGFAAKFYKQQVSIAYEKNAIDRNVKVLCEPLGLDVSTDMILKKEPFLFFNNEDNVIDDFMSKDKKNILFIVGASWPSKIYAKEKFASVANHLDANIIIAWGSSDEKAMADYIAKHSSACVLPKLDLNSLKAVVAKVDLVIGNDTGPTHMAWALNVPSITLFGNTPGYRNTYTTTINKVLESNSKVDACKLNKQDFSISEIEDKTVAKLACELIGIIPKVDYK